MKNDTVALALLGFAESLGAFGNICPNPAELRQAVRASDPNLRDDLNTAYLHSGATAMLVGLAASLLSGSLAPVVAAGLGSAASVARVELALPPAARLPLLGGTGRLALPSPVQVTIIEGQYRVLAADE